MSFIPACTMLEFSAWVLMLVFGPLGMVTKTAPSADTTVNAGIDTAPGLPVHVLRTWLKGTVNLLSLDGN